MGEPAIPALVDALCYDSHYKTRANAAGAIGNLVRNSASLCQALVDAGGVDAILTVAFTDLHVQPRRIALFSAGNLAVYATCRNAMLVWRQGSLENRMQSLM